MSIYRELFVEVPVALLEAAVIEAQTREAQIRHASVSRAAQLHIDFEHAAREICNARGIKMISTYRLADDRITVIRVRLPCRHVGHFELDETMLLRAASPREVVDYILDTMDREPHRRCFCDEPQGLGPAGRP